MHCRGVIGEQFLHSASNDLNVKDKSRLFSVFGISDNILAILYSPVRLRAVEGKEGEIGRARLFGD
jgi:hypothetical protein